MSDSPTDAAPIAGSIAWHDLTIDDAPRVRDFYEHVLGWKSSPVDMGGYADYAMADASGKVVAGVCHARGVNAGMPPQWMLYVCVPDVNAALQRAIALGGTLLHGPREMGGQSFAAISDPSGACLGIYGPARA